MSCIVLLIGVPGSGKTTFSGHLSRSLKNVQEVCLDNLLPLTEQQRLSMSPEDDENFRKSRKEVMFQTLEKIIKSDLEKEKVIVIDDNNYYSSMRYDYFRIARENNYGFCQIHISVANVDWAIKRNVERGEPVPETVVRRMYEKLETPKPMVNPWECFSFTVDSEALSGPDLELMLETCCSVISMASQNPPQKKEVPAHQTEGAKAASRVICNKNVIHQADKVLRKLLSARIKEEMRKENPEMGSVGQKLNSLKVEVLNDLKTKTAEIPEDVILAVESGDPESTKLLEQCLSGLLNIKLEKPNTE